jgi:hypothetical protein
VSDTGPLRAIETEYRRFRFRARTEARTAVVVADGDLFTRWQAGT